MKQQRVLIVLPYLEDGGGEALVLNIVENLTARGFHFQILCFRSKPSLFYDRIAKTTKIVDLKQRQRFRRDLPRLIRDTARVLSNFQPNVVLSILNEWNWVLLCAAKLSGYCQPIYAGEHGSILGSLKMSAAGWPKIARVRSLYRYLYSRSITRFVPCSRSLALELETAFGIPSKKIETIYNPVDLSAVAKLSCEDPELPWTSRLDVPIVIAVGRLIPHKAFDVLINAIKILQKQIEVRLLILGEGHLREQLERQILDLDLCAFVRMIGFRPNPYAYMRRASAFALSSVSEGLPYVLVEALSLGIPIVATDCPVGPREMLQNGACGLLVPCNDPDRLAAGLLRLLKDSELRSTLTTHGKLRALDFSLNVGLQRYESLFRG